MSHKSFMSGSWVNLGEIVSVDSCPGNACDCVLALVDSVSDPVVSGMNGFGSSESDCSVGDSLSGDVVAVDCGWRWLLVPECFEDD